MDPITALQLAPLILGGIQTGAGLLQKRPQYPALDYSVPESAQKALSNAEYVASQTQLPGYDTIKSNIGENLSGSIDKMARFADSPTAILSGITSMTDNANEQLQNLGVAGAQNYQNNQGILRNELGRVGGYENQGQIMEYQDKLRKFEMDSNRKQALIGSGLNNLYSGATDYAKLNFWNNLMAPQPQTNGVAQVPQKSLETLSPMGTGIPVVQPPSTDLIAGNPGAAKPLDTPLANTSGLDFWSLFSR